MRRAASDAGGELLRALADAVAGLDVRMAAEQVSSRDWASITFAGARHRLRLRLEGREAPAAVRALSRLDEETLALRGHLLADLKVEYAEETADRVRLDIGALTVAADWV